MKKISTIERCILAETVKSGGDCFIYKIHKKYRLTPGELSKTIHLLENKKLIELKDLRIKLTEKGKKVAYSGYFSEVSVGHRPWRECPDEFKQEPLLVNKPYIPRLSELDWSLIIKKTK